MKLFKTTIVFVFILIFSGCSPEPDRKEKPRKYIQTNMSERLIFTLGRTVDAYRHVISLLEEKEAIHAEVLKMYHDINSIHNEIIKEKEASAQVLETLQEQIVALDEILTSMDWPAEISAKLQTIKADIEKVQGDLKIASQEQEDQIVPVVEASVEEAPAEEEVVPVEEAEAPVEEAPAEEVVPVEEAETPVEEAPAEEVVPVEEAEAPVEEAPAEEAVPVEEAEAPVEEAPVEEAVPVEEAEAPVEEAPASGEAQEEEVVLETNIAVENIIVIE